METVISFTPAQLIAFVTTIGGAMAAIATMVTIIFKLVNRMKAPEDKQNRRIEALETENEKRKKDIAELEKRLNDGNNRFDNIEQSNKITLETLRALLKHALGGDESELKDAERNLDNYLIQNRTRT